MTSPGGIAFVVNAGAGTSGWFTTHRADVEAVAAGAPIALVHDGNAIAAAVAAALASGCRCIVAGGGDGTISAVATRLVDRDVALGVLPLGTLNHFAKDLGIPADPDAALGLLGDAATILEVDVGEVNGRVFVNNASLGLYPAVVHHRERQQERLGRGKWPAFAWSVVAALRRYPFLDIDIALEGSAPKAFRTPFLFVGNNDYRMQGMDIGTRGSLREGRLGLYLAHRTGRWGLLRMAARALLGSLEQDADFRTTTATAFVVASRHRRISIATDGEVQVMETPLRFRIRPRSLKVLVPAASAAAA